MSLPQNCCACLSLKTGTYCLSGFATIGHFFVLIDTSLCFNTIEKPATTKEIEEIFHSLVIMWSITGIVVNLFLFFGIKMVCNRVLYIFALQLMKIYIFVAPSSMDKTLSGGSFFVSYSSIYEKCSCSYI